MPRLHAAVLCVFKKAFASYLPSRKSRDLFYAYVLYKNVPCDKSGSPSVRVITPYEVEPLRPTAPGFIR